MSAARPPEGARTAAREREGSPLIARPPGMAFAQACTVPVDHPAFAGHFPGQPILPGVAVLAQVLAVWRQAGAALPPPPQPLRLAMAKFLAPVGPGAVLHIELTAEPRQLRFAVSVAGQAAAQGAFALEAP